MKLEEAITMLPKSKVKAGDGKKKGKYPLYRCSNKIDTYYDEYIIDIEAIIIGTGGNPSIHYNTGKCAYTTQCLAITSKGVLKNKYIYYYLLSQLDRIQNMFRGMTIKQLDKKEFFKLEIPMIEVEIQDKIIENLDIIANNIQSKKEQLKKLEQLIKSQFVEMFGDISDGEKKHKIVKLSEIAEYYNGLTYKPTDVSESGTIVLRSGNIQNSKLEYSDVVRVKCNIKEKQYVKEKDILMCSRNGSEKLVGKVAMIREAEEKMTFGAFMLIIRSKYYSYLFSYFQSDDFRKKIKQGTTTTINQITVNMLNKIELPMPNIQLQNQFAEIVKQIDKQKFEIEKSLKETQELYESLMEEYF